MGMIDVFVDGVADFSAISNDRLFIEYVLHKSFVEVDESGTEAAAATAVVATMGGAGRRIDDPTRVFRADRPFIFLIRHGPTGSILFMGRIVNPLE
jgi:serpin B